MCGVFGWITRKETCPGLTRLTKLTDTLGHRGPDGSGVDLFASRDERYSIGLGHRRLSIVDLSAAAAQPMWSEDGSCCITYNGEIYNFVELRAELQELGWRFRSSGDTEVLLAALRQWGPEALPRLRGMFAFAFYDKTTNEALLARDAFGKKPLFLARSRGDLFFSSEIAPLRDILGEEACFNPDALDGYLLDRYVPGPQTFFTGVEKLPPGSFAVWRGGAFSVQRYFTPPIATTMPDFDDFEDAVEAFRACFEESVAIRLRSDAPFGLFLSGGVDSSAVLAAMSRCVSGPVHTFTAGFHEKEFSEIPCARLIAKHFGAEHNELVVSANDFFEIWPEAVRMRGAPVSEASDIPLFMLAREASKSVKVALTGEGSDEILAGYPKYRAELYTGAYHAVIPPAVHERLIAPLVAALPYSLRRVKILSKALGRLDIADRVRIWFGGLSTQERDALLHRRHSHGFSDPYPFSIKNVSNLRRAQFFDQTSYLPDNSLERGDRMLMAGSIEGRMPFMDVELAKLAARMPDSFLIRRGADKAVLREAYRSILPRSILCRKKIGFIVPYHQWFRTSHSWVLRDLLTSRDARVRELLHGAIIDRFVEDHINGRTNQERILWSLCNLEQFLRVFKFSRDELREAMRNDG
jgi:asparagine synthase (glutamine-hydrolysing)